MLKRKPIDTSLDKVLKDYVEETMEDKFDKELKDSVIDEHEQSINELIRTIAVQIPEDSRVYIKVYKKHPLPEGFADKGLLYLHVINNVSEIDDIEIYLHNLSKKYGWGSGVYQLRVYRTDKKGMAIKPLELSMYTNDEQEKNDKTIFITPEESKPEKDYFSEIEKVATLASKLTDMTRPAQQLSPDSIMNTIITSLKTGIDLMKNNQSSQVPNVSPDVMITAITTALKTGIELGIPQKSNNIQETISLLKELGLLNLDQHKKEDKEEKSLIDQLMELKTLGDTLGIFNQAQPSAIALLIQSLAPKIPEIIKSISDPIKAIVDLKKMQLTGNLRPTAPLIPPSEISQEQTGINVINPSVPFPKTEELMNPTLSTLYNAIQSKDKSFYPQLKNLLEIFIGQHIISSLINNTIPVDVFLQSLSTTFNQSFFNDEKTKQYFSEFLSAVAINYKSIIGVCSSCNAEYEYDSKEYFDADIKKCSCGGSIQKIEESAQKGNV
ncbi:MAG: hypothetical protein DDT19_00775 [Syntrophomonadaceae bacterium]|nr:hypothetical protein [Bacillota bacterium]